jgi:catechol 2,3-dioxygenase-like lactoylglutathione lyase family enzyme
MTMEIGAVLDHLHLSSPDPAAVAEFYARHYGMAARADRATWLLNGPARRLAVSPGSANRLLHAAWRFPDTMALEAYRTSLEDVQFVGVPQCAFLEGPHFAVVDPDGTLCVFMVGRDESECAAGDLPAAVNQHFALRTPDPARLLHFYAGTLRFTLSDRVEDGAGTLKACFLRTDRLHHSLALFGAPVSRFDHQSFETPTWTDLRDWADHMARLKTPMAWGVGRHGPGNDVFFMIADPDGNLAEISSEIEVCEAGRPVGVWPHEERTLNVWGRAIMRS